MYKLKLFAFVIFIITNLTSYAQNNINGQVLDAKDQATLPGVNISIQGTSNGVITDMDGKFTLDVELGQIMIFTFVGYQQKEVEVVNLENITVVLEEEVEELKEVVVTALGISKEKQALGYAVSEVGGDDLTQVNTGSVANSLGGRVTGVQISGNRPGQASSISIRGNASLKGNNYPLIVIDGVPMDGGTKGGVGKWGGTDKGDALSMINPDDIASTSVLKGAAATALYGSRASNGVLLITTKTGKKKDGIGVDFNSSMIWSVPNDMLTSRQNIYGQGVQGRIPSSEAEVRDTGLSSWGAKMNDQDYTGFDGNTYRYSDRWDPMSLFSTGHVFNNSIAVSAGNEAVQTRVSYANQQVQDIQPNSTIKRNSISARVNTDQSKRLFIDTKLTYIHQDASRSSGGESTFNPSNAYHKMPATQSSEILKRNRAQPSFINDVYTLNPYWVMDNLNITDIENKVLLSANVGFELFKGVKINYRNGLDFTSGRDLSITPVGTPYISNGESKESMKERYEMNHDLYLSLNKDFGKFNISGIMGANMMRFSQNNVGIEMTQFYSDWYHVSNAGLVSGTQNHSEKEMNSIYGSLDFGYDSWLYLTVTGRNDWTSTLPAGNNSYFYPSFSSSIVFSEKINLPVWFTLAKVRGSWAQVGSDTDPYKLYQTFRTAGNGFNNKNGNRILPAGYSGAMNNADLLPEMTSSIEFGADLGFFHDRINFNFTYYDQVTEDQIINMDISDASGFTSRMVNAGSMSNTGYEVSLNLVPVVNRNFHWNVGIHYTQNKNKVNSLIGDMQKITISDYGDVRVDAIVGEEYGVIMGRDYSRNENGEIEYDENGIPNYTSELVSIGSMNPTAILGYTSSFNYKKFSLNVVLDQQIGGQFYSGTNADMYQSGTHINTLEGRDLYYTQGIGPNPEIYYNRISEINSEFIRDASYIRVKEISLGYGFSKSLLEKIHLSSARISAVFSNPFFIWKATENVDPTAILNASSTGRAVEMIALPSVRSYGFNLNVSF
ncbi:SusC/RagA family TonB-linked outer membrane protein [Flammeovirga sp. SJP92]|uniref:SusC/RagA family TonB-linked outer membrane protein n=1 Tax=Flammeovirga sp. SJP92 TaxID=1775430 RepID=UPI0007868E7C|nr:SusC/RagA family TonB-linked outer membrane protein [Flammeovirga sp. SJP92]KXX71784.1 hypothetical protein AVL50_03090 [Flammeovirga sp. SJP92]